MLTEHYVVAAVLVGKAAYQVGEVTSCPTERSMQVLEHRVDVARGLRWKHG
jgi:hypothetical protein